MQHLPSRLLEAAVNEMASLPGIGKKTAIRLVLHLLKRSPAEVHRFANSFVNMRQEIKYCQECFNISDSTICQICADQSRDHKLICVVEDIRDVMAIENTRQYRGIYHVLGGVISPMDGIGPSDLNIEQLVQKVSEHQPEEIIMALSATMEGDTTNFYLYKKLKSFPVRMSTLARGVAVGDELAYADELTLGRSILNRTPFEQSIQR